MDTIAELVARKLTMERLAMTAALADQPLMQAVYAHSAARLEFQITAYIVMQGAKP